MRAGRSYPKRVSRQLDRAYGPQELRPVSPIKRGRPYLSQTLCDQSEMAMGFPLLHGFKTVFHANPMDAKTIGELAAAHHATLLLSTPTFCLNYLHRCAKDQFHALRYLLVGAEKLRPALVEAFQEKFGITPLEGYGCTEMAPAVAVNGSAAAEARCWATGTSRTAEAFRDGFYVTGDIGRLDAQHRCSG
jgi:hypothetical protein